MPDVIAGSRGRLCAVPAAILAAWLLSACATLLSQFAPPATPVPAPSARPEQIASVATIPPTAEPQLRLSWQGETAPRALLVETQAGPIRVHHLGDDSLMLNFNGTVVHLNPWALAADYAQLPKADQIWITDPEPEHLDLRAIRAVSKQSTRLIVDAESSALIHGLLAHYRLGSGVAIAADNLQIQALPALRIGFSGGEQVIQSGNSYLVEFGGVRLLVAARPHLLPGLQQLGPVDLAVLIVHELAGLPAAQAGTAARQLQLQAMAIYAYDQAAASTLEASLEEADIAFWPLDLPEHAHQHAMILHPSNDAAWKQSLSEQPDQTDDLNREKSPALPLLPDLQTLPPSDLRLLFNSYTQTTLLRLTNSVVNLGDGPLEMWGESDSHEGVHEVSQRIYDSDGEYRQLSLGEFVFHPQHAHWHFDSFSLYELWSLRPDGSLDQVLATSGKVSFCLRDNFRFPHPNQARWASYTSCGTARQGISVGWVDTYQYYLAGQTIDISGVPDGTYALLSTADPFNLILETIEGNNFAAVYVRIHNGSVSLITPPASP